MAPKKRVGKRKSTLINFIKHTIKSGVSNMNSADAPACMPIVALEKNSNLSAYILYRYIYQQRKI